jgi:phage protein D
MKLLDTLFVELRAGETEYTRYLDGLTFEDCTKEDDIVKLTMKNVPVELIDDPNFVAGKVLEYRFGYVGGRMSKLRKARITDIDTNFSEVISLTVTAHDFGQVLKKAESSKVWKKQTSSQIVQAIADTYGMKVEAQPTKKIWDQLPQGNATDWDFLKTLATKEGYQVIVKEDVITFKPLDLSKPAKRAYKWNVEKNQSDIVSFKPSYKDSGAKDGKVQTPTIDLSKSKVDIPTIDAKDLPALGKELVQGTTERKDANFNKKEIEKLKGSTLHTHGKDSYSSKNHAKHKAKKNAMKVLTASLRMQGDPLVNAGEIITVEGVGKKFGGNWYVEKVVHKIDAGGFETTLELTKNGANASLTAKGKKAGVAANTKAGEPSKTTKVAPKRYRFDGNSNPVKVK